MVSRIWRLARRLPFTLMMEAAIVAIAATQGALAGGLSLEKQQRWGFGLHSLWEGRWHTLISEPFFVRDVRQLLGIVLLVAYSVGMYEWVAGTRQALLLYWATNVAGLALAAVVVVWPLYLMGLPMARTVAFFSDVGPSAGGLACIAGWVRNLPLRHRRWLVPAILMYLIAKLLFFPELFADSAHLMTFPLGYALAGRPTFAAPLTRPQANQ
jgi:hypothetical protein